MEMARKGIGAFLTGSFTSKNNDVDIVYKGTLNKRKNMKSKFFILRKETKENGKTSPARLEYYDSEKKYKEGGTCKKKIILKDCILINARSDDTYKNMIGLYLQKECFLFVAENEEQMNTWVGHLNENKYGSPEESHKVEYTHVWTVDVIKRSFACANNLNGEHLVCLTSSLLSFVKKNPNPAKTEFPLTTIRKIGCIHRYFYIEFGRSAVTGSGGLWMQTDDSFIAANMNSIIGSTMNRRINTMNKGRERTYSMTDVLSHPEQRLRTESLPISVRSGFVNKSKSLRHKTPTDPAGPSNSLHQTNGIISSSPYDPDYDDTSESFSEEDILSKEVELSERHLNTVIYNTLAMEDVSEYVPMDLLAEGSVPSTYDEVHKLHLNLPNLIPNHSTETTNGYTPMGPRSGFFGSISPVPVSNLPTSCNSSWGDCIDSSKNPRLQLGSKLTSIPIPNSPSDNTHMGMSPNSGSSSLNTSTPSDHRMHDFSSGEGELGSGLSQNLSGEEMDSIEIRPMRTSSVGSKPDQYKRKNSAPMLGTASVSHSWSGGTPGSYFPMSANARNHPPEYKMEVDLRNKNKSYDYIPGDERDSKGMNRLWSAITGNRPRSNSKSSAGSTSRGSEGDTPRAKRISESDEERGKRLSESNETHGVEIPKSQVHGSYFEMDFSPSPRSTGSSAHSYLIMHPPSSSYLTSNNGSRGSRHTSINESYTDMSQGNTPNNEYVDMSQGNGDTSALSVTSSSEDITRRMSASGRSVMNTTEMSSPTDDFMNLPSKESENCQKRIKKERKRKSMKDGALSTLSNLISRKPSSSSSKTPLSPLGCTLPKAAKDSSSPFSTLTRSGSKDGSQSNIIYSEMDGHRRMDSVSSDAGLSISPPNNADRRLFTGSMDMTHSFNSNHEEDKMYFDPAETRRLLGKTPEKRMSAHLSDTVEESKRGSLPSLHTCIAKISPNNPEVSEYMNMQPGSSSPQLSPPAKKEKPNPSSEEESHVPPSFPPVPNQQNNPYMMMDASKVPSHNPTSSSSTSVTLRPTIPSTLLTTSNVLQSPPALGLEKLAITESTGSSMHISERCRSHSGPQGSSADKKDPTKEELRATSACSSPIGSPPRSPVLSSMSSFSSLSEGGMSSASSTCTVFNMGAPKSNTKLTTSTGASCSELSLKSSDSCSLKEDVIYACLDLGENKTSPIVIPKNIANKPPVSEDPKYVTIDFTKSEGLRNTCLARESSRPH